LPTSSPNADITPNPVTTTLLHLFFCFIDYFLI
jgi:hypothetical protein